MKKIILILMFVIVTSITPLVSAGVLDDLSDTWSALTGKVTGVVYYRLVDTYTVDPFSDKEFKLLEKTNKIQGWDELGCSRTSCFCREASKYGSDKCFYLSTPYGTCNGDVNTIPCDDLPPTLNTDFTPYDENGVYGYIPIQEGICYKSGANNIYKDYCWEEGICKPCWATIERVDFSILKNSWENSNLQNPDTDRDSSGEEKAESDYCQQYPTSLACQVLRDSDNPNCADGTTKGECSEDKPLYCNLDGMLIDRASVCGCPQGQVLHPELNEMCIDDDLILCYTTKSTTYWTTPGNCRKVYVKDWLSGLKNFFLSAKGLLLMVIVLVTLIFRNYILAIAKRYGLI